MRRRSTPHSKADADQFRAALTERMRKFNQVGRLWRRALSRHSQNGRVLWDRMRRLITRWLPVPSVCHPYPQRRMGVIT